MINNGVLILAEQKKGNIHPISYELLNKGRELADQLGEPLLCLLLGPTGMNPDELIRRGADRVYHVEDDDLFRWPNELVLSKNAAQAIERIKPQICLIGATALGRSIGPRIAAILRIGLTADCTELAITEDGKLIQIRPAFSGNILAHITSKTMPQMATVRYREFPEAERDVERTGEIIKWKPGFTGDGSMEVLEELASMEKSISDYEVVVAGGAGIRRKEDLQLLWQLADRLGGTVGASRALVDSGVAPKALQVGYSGNRVKPRLYIACGISGAPQHLAGMKEAGTIIAINSDPSAPIFAIADYGIVGDLYQIVPQLAALKGRS